VYCCADRRHGQVDDREAESGRPVSMPCSPRRSATVGGAAAGRGDDRDARRSPEPAAPAAGVREVQSRRASRSMSTRQDAAIAEETHLARRPGRRAAAGCASAQALRPARSARACRRRPAFPPACAPRAAAASRSASRTVSRNSRIHARLGVLHQQLDHLADARSALVADRDQLREAEAVRRAGATSTGRASCRFWRDEAVVPRAARRSRAPRFTLSAMRPGR